MPACDMLENPSSKAFILFTCLIGSFMATSHCLGKQLQVISVLSAGYTPTFQAFCLLHIYIYITCIHILVYSSYITNRFFELHVNEASNDNINLLILIINIKLNLRHSRYNTNGLNKKDLVPAAIMIYGSFKSVSNGVPF